MFFIIDKSKIFSYAIAICTVVILFVAAAGINSLSNNEATITSSNAVMENKEILKNDIGNIIENSIN